MATLVYVKDGKEIPGDSWVTWVSGAGAELQTQPINMTTVQMGRAGVTTVQEDPMPDPFYGPVIKDPNNPGKWIQTPYTPDEMKLRLETYSANVRGGYEVGSIIVHPPTGSDYGASTSRDDRSIYNNTFNWLQGGGASTATAKVMRVKTLSPPAYGSVLFVQADITKMAEINNAVSKWSDLCFATEHDLFNQIEAGTLTTKDAIDAAYLSMRDSNFPITP